MAYGFFLSHSKISSPVIHNMLIYTTNSASKFNRIHKFYTKYYVGYQIKDSKMGSVVSVGGMRNPYKISVKKMKGRNDIKDLCV